MIETRHQAMALHTAIEERTDAWINFNNAARMPERQMDESRLAAAAERWVAAERAVEQLSLGMPIIDAIATETENPTSAPKRRGRPKKAAPPIPPETPEEAAERRTEEEVKAAEAAATAGGGDGDAA